MKKLLSIFLLLASVSAYGEWRRLESEHIIFYSEQSLEEAVEHVRGIEVQINLLEKLWAQPIDTTARKLELISIESSLFEDFFSAEYYDGAYLHLKDHQLGVIRRPLTIVDFGADNYLAGALGLSRTARRRIRDSDLISGGPAIAFYYIANTAFRDFPYWYIDSIRLISNELITFRDSVTARVGIRELTDPSEISPLEELFDDLQISNGNNNNLAYMRVWVTLLSKFTESPELRNGLETYFNAYIAGESDPSNLAEALGMSFEQFSDQVLTGIKNFPIDLDGPVLQFIGFQRQGYEYEGEVSIKEIDQNYPLELLEVASVIIENKEVGELESDIARSQLSYESIPLIHESLTLEESELPFNGRQLLQRAILDIESGNFEAAEQKLNKLHFFSHQLNIGPESLPIHGLIESVRSASENSTPVNDVLQVFAEDLKWYSSESISNLASLLRATTQVTTGASIEPPLSTTDVFLDSNSTPDQMEADDMIGQLERLSELFQNGLLTEEEFSAAKKRLLN